VLSDEATFGGQAKHGYWAIPFLPVLAELGKLALERM